MYHEIHTALKKRMRTFFPDLELKHIRERIRTDIAAELAARGISDRIPAKLFEKVYIDLRKESVYLNQILPLAIRTMDPAPREDFMENSGLDRFYIESLEKEFFEEKTLEPALLDLLREEGELSGTGGGERI